jgi:hypothetical protein
VALAFAPIAMRDQPDSSTAPLATRNAGVRAALSWHANRLTDPSPFELGTSVAGTALAITFIVYGIAVLVLGLNDPKTVPTALLMLTAGSAFAALCTLSLGQQLYRRGLRRRLASSGVQATAVVLDRWQLNIGRGYGGLIRLRYPTSSGTIEALASDEIDLITQIRVGDELPLTYDPDNPRRLLLADQGWRLRKR